jgi:hypothetical protein
VTETAKESPSSKDISAKDKELIASYFEQFEPCLARGDAAGAAEAAFAIATLAHAQSDEAIVRRIRRSGTEQARTTRSTAAQKKEMEIAKAFQWVARREKIPLKAGEKHIEIYFRPSPSGSRLNPTNCRRTASCEPSSLT